MFSVVVVIGWYCLCSNGMFGWRFVDGSVLFELLRCAQCNHAFACSLAATMHTHTAPPTSYCTSVPFSHCFCLLSPPGTMLPWD